MPMRVLLVDDSRQVQAALRALLSRSPEVIVVGGAEDCAGALALIEDRAPDLVVLDVELAHGDRGYDLLRCIRSRHPWLRVVVLSNFGWEAMRKPFIDAGAQAYFDKALEFRQAIDWIRERAGAGTGSPEGRA